MSSTQDVDRVIDFDQPLFCQVWKAGEKYEEWVHKPTMRKSFRMFHNEFVETFASTPWYVVPLFWGPIIALMARTSMVGYGDVSTPPVLETNSSVYVDNTNMSVPRGPLNESEFFIHFIIGLVYWTFMEYIMHRHLFHTPIKGNNWALITAHFLLHGQHHKFPMDKGRLVFPIVPASIIAISVYWGTLRMVLSPLPALAIHSGFISGYVAYDMTHYYTHFGSPTFGYLAKLKKSHMKHHFKDIKHGYGISSEIWDHVFGTHWPMESHTDSKNK